MINTPYKKRVPNGTRSLTVGLFGYLAVSILLIIGLIIGLGGCSNESKSEAATAAATSAPDAPTGLSFSNIKGTSLTVEWTAPTNPGKNADGSAASIKSYTLEVSADDTFSTGIAGSPFSVSQRSHTVDNLTVNTPYYFRVKATNSADLESGWLTGEESTTKATAPDAPTGLSFSNIQGTALTVEWTAPTNPGNNADGSAASIKSYTLEVSADNTFSTGIAGSPFSVSQRSHTVDNLTVNTQYYFRVKATNSADLESGWLTGEKSIQATAPDAPTGLSFSNIQDTALTVGWTAPTNPGKNADGGVASIKSYTLEVSTDDTFSTGIAGSPFSVSQTSHTVDNLTVNTPYYFRVKATNSADLESGWLTGEKSIPKATAPDAPTGLSFSNIQGTSLTVEWTAPTNPGNNADGGVASIKSYTLEVSADNTFSTGIAGSPFSVSQRSHTVDNLTVNTQYYFRVKATNSADLESGWLTGDESTTKTTAPDAPTGLSFSNIQRTALTVEWTAPTNPGNNADGGVASIKSYTLEVSADDAFSSGIAGSPFSVSQISHTVDNLTVNTQYYFRVKATNSADMESGWLTGSQSTSNFILTYSQTLKDGVDGLNGARSVTVSPDGNNVYVAGSNDHAVAVFNRNTEDGTLTFSQALKGGVDGVDGLLGAISVAVSPDEKNVYVAGETDDAVAVFNRNTEDGTLTFSQALKNTVPGVDGLDKVASVAVSPDGKNVYAAGYDDDAVAVFNRNTEDGTLTLSQTLKNTVSGVDGLDGAISVAVSPDGNNVYVAGHSNNAVAVFNRNAADGTLTFSQALKDEVDGVDGLAEAISVAVSRDGNNVYVAAYNDKAVAVFNRNTENGTLTFSQALKDGVDGVDGLDGARYVTVSPDGNNVYATGLSEGAVAVFNRDTENGRLTFSQAFKNTGVAGLNGAISVTVSLDGKNVYATGYFADAVVVFDRE